MPSLLIGRLVFVVASLLALPARARSLPGAVERMSPDPVLLITEASRGSTAASRYRAYDPSRLVPSGVPLVLIFRGEQLNTPDSLAVAKASLQGEEIRVDLVRRQYQGDFQANGITLPLVEVDLGSLPAGTYHVLLQEKELPFADLEHPERVGSGTEVEVGEGYFSVG